MSWWGSDKAGDDNSPAVAAENAGLDRRTEIALTRENGRVYGQNRTAQTIRERTNTRDDASGLFGRRH